MKANQPFTLPVILSVLMHAALLIFVAGNWFSASKPDEVEYRPHYVTATLVELAPKAIAAPPQPKPQVLENNRRQEQERRQQQERERQQAEAKKQQEKKAQAAKAEQERLNKAKAEQARVKAAEDAKRKAAEEERKRQEAQREARERLEAALQKEEQFLSDRSDAVTVQSYEALIRQRIEESWSRPPSARMGMQAILEINMVPTGQVVNVRVVKGSGDIAFDRSAEQAVKRVDRFSEIQGMPNDIFERNFRVFRLLFQPEDLRQ